jgi:hypothetical protein
MYREYAKLKVVESSAEMNTHKESNNIFQNALSGGGGSGGGGATGGGNDGGGGPTVVVNQDD